MPTCDVCNQEIEKLAASRCGRWGLDLCHTCWTRLRKRERRAQLTLPERAAAAQQDGPPYAWPACEWCGGDLDQHGLGYYTTKSQPRRFCCIECRQYHNSRAGAPIRAAKARQRVRAGTWQNPAAHLTHAEHREIGRIGGEARAVQLRAEVAAGTWQNPADAPGAREKLSRPRVHGDNPILHRALEKLTQGLRVADLEPEEAESHRAYQRALRAADPERFRQYTRDSRQRRRTIPQEESDGDHERAL